MRGLIIKILLALVSVGLIGGLIATIIFVYLNLELPKIEKLQDYKPNLASQIISKDGVILAEIGKEKREIVQIEDVPARVIDAFLSAEDDKFFEHKGVDYFGLVRAMIANFKAGRVVQGGSTITQQVAKSLLLTSERSITRKVKDFVLAQKIEEKLSKKDILHLYLNQVYLGNGYYGVKAASRGYYNKELKNISVAEAAMLAGLLVAPGKYSPYNNPVPAKKRQHYVLERMYKLKKISKSQFESALIEKIVYYIHEDDLKAGYFTEWVRQKVVDAVGEDEFLTNGFIVNTTLDWSLQKIAEEQVSKGVKDIDKRQGYKGPHAHINQDEYLKFELENRKKIFKKRSRFFVIDDKNEKKYEYNFSEVNLTNIKEESEKLKKASGDDTFIAGLSDKDEIQNVLEAGEQYDAIVTKVDDNLKLIHIDLAGSPGVIPFEYFKWAHKRSVSENTAYYQDVTKPTTILKPGDLIYVQLVKSAAPLNQILNKDSQLNLAKNKYPAIYKNQKYIICSLDQIPEVQGALFSIDARTGEIISYVGGYDFKTNKFNRVIQAKRQPGSSFKPVLFAAALEHGYTPTTIIMDTPEAMPGFDSASSWKPKNYEGDYKGPVTVRTTLEESRNIPTIKMADKVGVSNLIKFAERIGFNAKLENNLSIALGTFGVSPRDLVATYAIFPNGGKRIIPKGIISVTDREGKKYVINEDPDAKNLDENKDNLDKVQPEQKNPYLRNLHDQQVYDSRLAFIMTSLMKGVVTHGTAASARDLSPNIAGKTGTTSDFIDAWFVGYTSNVVTGVWAGFDDNKTMGHGETGAKAVLPTWKEYMRANIKKFGDQSFEAPAGIISSWVDKETGRKANPNTSGAILEYFADNSATDETISNDQSKKPVLDQNGSEVNPIKPATPKTRSLGDDEYFENQ
jgi:penicillin-binding protein 1A